MHLTSLMERQGASWQVSEGQPAARRSGKIVRLVRYVALRHPTRRRTRIRHGPRPLPYFSVVVRGVEYRGVRGWLLVRCVALSSSFISTSCSASHRSVGARPSGCSIVGGRSTNDTPRRSTPGLPSSAKASHCAIASSLPGCLRRQPIVVSPSCGASGSLAWCRAGTG